MSYKLSNPSPTIVAQAQRILSSNGLTPSSPAAAKAGAVFRFVRDEIRFGFTWRFDMATPEHTLSARRGHCNPQSALFASLLHGVGVKASQRFVELSPGVLRGVVNPGGRVVHSCVVAEVRGREWCVDGFIVGKGVFAGAKRRLEREGRDAGYGIAADGCCEWDGNGDCFVQMTKGVGEELGVFDEPRRFLESDRNFQKLGWAGMGALGVASVWINRRIDALAEV